MTSKIITALITVLAGVGAALALYWLLNKIAELLPGRSSTGSSRSSTSCPPISPSPST